MRGVEMSDTVSLYELPRTLRDMTGRRTSYQTLWRNIMDSDLTAQKNAAGRWMIKREDVVGIAAKLTKGA
jgi:hypothetical protein